MERIEILHHLRRAYRWIGDKGLPIPYDDAVARIACGRAVEVQS